MSDEIVRDFLIESSENLDLLDRELIKLEKKPGDRETLSSIFRTIHTIKGTCGFLGFTKLGSVAHAGENLLSLLRDGTITVTPERTTALLSLVDVIRQMLESIENSESEGERDDRALVQTLERLQKDEGATEKKDSASADVPEVAPPLAKKEASAAQLPGGTGLAGEVVKQLGIILVEQGIATAEQVAAAIQKQLEGDARPLGEILIEKGEVKTQEVLAAVQAQQAAKSGLAESSIRVDVTLLDRLMNLVGELVLVRNQIVQHAHSVPSNALAAAGQRLNLITSELQEGVMKTRTQPIGNSWSKVPRTVRDVATNCGKQVRIEMVGQETELDKTVIEAIKDPLTHLVRNSVDHGIETPAVRLAAGKPAEGLLRLRAYQEGEQVNIEISDDGAGLNCEKIRKKAVQRGLIKADQAARMTESEAANLIFLPGFSTAEAVTNVSGRGVGMDVVKTNIEKIGGTVQVQTVAGAGTTVRMNIPLTLAIVPVLLVTDGGERYAIPQVSLLELLRIETCNLAKSIENVQGAPVFRLRGQLLPLVYLRKELGIEAQGGAGGAVNIVVLQTDGRRFGLVVAEVNDTEEIVVKPLGKQLKGIRAFAGATILDDGKAALILDVRRLAQSAQLSEERQANGNSESAAKENAGDAEQEKRALLVFQSGLTGRMAIELSIVARLEEFSRERVERAGEREVVQYRGEIMPLVRVSDAFRERGGTAEPAEGERLQVVVVHEGGKTIGLVVDQILDIVEERITLEQPVKRAGVRGSAVIQERVTDLLEPGELVRLATAHALRRQARQRRES
jgi:two-component system, chemotaxis family, sensor kinase CheA